mgnify:CR=1 FL=1
MTKAKNARKKALNAAAKAARNVPYPYSVGNFNYLNPNAPKKKDKGSVPSHMGPCVTRVVDGKWTSTPIKNGKSIHQTPARRPPAAAAVWHP